MATNFDLPFPQPLVERYRPAKVSEFAGLERPKAILRSWLSRPYPANWMFVGAPGTGKTTMALALARELGAELHHIPSQKCTVDAVEDVVRRCWYVPMSGALHLVLVDEADQMTPQAQLALLSKLDSTAAPPNTVWIFTANATSRLDARFLSRCRVIQFGAGAADDVVKLLAVVWQSEVAAHPPDFTGIVDEAGGNVREALMRLEVEILAAGMALA